MEVTKSTNSFASDASVLNLPYPLYGFQFTENNNRKLRIVHNTSANTVAYTDTFYCNFNNTRIIKSWDNTDTSFGDLKANSLVSVNVNIPAYSHILIVNSALAADTVLGFNTFDSVFVGSSDLPINNLSIEGSVKNCKTTINLTVTNETNTSSYQLQASTDESNFTHISTLPAHFNSLGSKDIYHFEVNPALSNFSFYRIKTTDHDGNNSFSKVVYV